MDEMLKYVELEYNKLTEKCAALIGEISVSFRTSCRVLCRLISLCRTATSPWIGDGRIDDARTLYGSK